MAKHRIKSYSRKQNKWYGIQRKSWLGLWYDPYYTHIKVKSEHDTFEEAYSELKRIESGEPQIEPYYIREDGTMKYPNGRPTHIIVFIVTIVVCVGILAYGLLKHY